jgi:hypothetical protein
MVGSFSQSLLSLLGKDQVLQPRPFQASIPTSGLNSPLHHPPPLAYYGALHQRRIQNPKLQRANICVYPFKAASLIELNAMAKKIQFLKYACCQGHSAGHSYSLLNEGLHVILSQQGWFTIHRTAAVTGHGETTFHLQNSQAVLRVHNIVIRYFV